LCAFCFVIKVSAQPPNYLVQHFNTENGLTQNSIKGIQIDKKGYVWMVTETGIVRYDGTNFKVYDRSNSPQLKANRMTNITSVDGKIYVEADEERIYRISENGKIEMTPSDFLRKANAYFFPFYNNYSIYAACTKKFQDAEIAEWALPNVENMRRSLLNSIVLYREHYYYFNNKAELISTDTALTSFCKVKLVSTSANKLPKKRNRKSLQSLMVSRGKLYMRWSNMIYQLNFAKNGSELDAKPILDVGNIETVSCFTEYPEQNVSIVGTSTDGFYLFRENYFSSLTVNANEGNVFYAQAPFGTNGVLTNKGVLYPDGFVPLTGYNSETVLKAKSGDYYLYGMKDLKDPYEAGIIVLNNKLQQHTYRACHALPINCFRQLNDGTIWVSTKDAKGKFIGRLDRDSIMWVKTPPTMPAEFGIESFILASDNDFWIAGNKGLVCYDTTKKIIEPIDELNGVYVRSLYEDSRGTIWIGTFGKGYYAWYKDRLIAMPMDRNHYLIAAHSFIEDKLGYMWITTNRGLFQVSAKDLNAYLDQKVSSVYYQYYDQREGLITNEFNGGCTPSAIELANGKFSLPTMKGLVQFDPLSVKPVFPSSDIFIDAIDADGKSVDRSLDSFTVSNNTRHIQFAVSSPYFGNTYNQTIEYRLEPNGNKWYTINRSGIVEFNNLARGDYRLLLRKAKGFGANNYAQKAIFFSIPLFFYETPLFRAILIFSFPLLLLLLSRLRVQYLIRHKERLEKEIVERTKRQADLIDELETTVHQLEASREESNRNNAFKEQLAMIIAHDLQSPLRFFSSATHRMDRLLHDREEQNAKELSSELVKASDNIYGFVEDMTIWIGSMGKNFQLQKADVNLYELLAEQKLFFTEQLRFRNNEMKLLVDDNKIVHTDRQLLKIILRNVIDNANKNTYNGTIRISMNKEFQNGALIITDTGEGMTKEKLRQIRELVHIGKRSLINGQRSHGNGYRFIGHFCDLLGISAKIESEQGRGTSVFLYNI
jgi:signal transduction histidine kinase